MLCPFCGSEMTAGFIKSARKVFFSKTPNNGVFVLRKKEEPLLTQDNWTGPYCEAFCCYDCAKVIVDYSKE